MKVKISFLLINPSLQSNINLGLDVVQGVLEEIGVDVVRFDLLNPSIIERKNMFDFVGVGFITPMNFFNLYKISHLLEMGHIKIAGGAGVMNPAPISDFFDVFVIGEGEIPIKKIIQCYRMTESKSCFLKKISNITGVYVPKSVLQKV